MKACPSGAPEPINWGLSPVNRKVFLEPVADLGNDLFCIHFIPAEELRLLDYGQRLLKRRRALLAGEGLPPTKNRRI
jgi:hypothetical protein